MTPEPSFSKFADLRPFSILVFLMFSSNKCWWQLQAFSFLGRCTREPRVALPPKGRLRHFVCLIFSCFLVFYRSFVEVRTKHYDVSRIILMNLESMGSKPRAMETFWRQNKCFWKFFNFEQLSKSLWRNMHMLCNAKSDVAKVVHPCNKSTPMCEDLWELKVVKLNPVEWWLTKQLNYGIIPYALMLPHNLFLNWPN